MRGGSVRELIAFDQDAQSLAVVADACTHLPVRTMKGRVQDVINGSISFCNSTSFTRQGCLITWRSQSRNCVNSADCRGAE